MLQSSSAAVPYDDLLLLSNHLSSSDFIEDKKSSNVYFDNFIQRKCLPRTFHR